MRGCGYRPCQLCPTVVPGDKMLRDDVGRVTSVTDIEQRQRLGGSVSSIERKGTRKMHRSALDHEGFKWQTTSEGDEEETDNGNC
ncbi:hypothetical protein PUN28_006424 [Cardiocondyla obscurior]|uniref:Uncharacterized protein n=1 Tax=Cardiocondyla obscurior TaxID=286306 RepID=A0AAW2GA89_9HYME